MPFDDNSFDKALAINSMQIWPDAVAGLRELQRVVKTGRPDRAWLYALFRAAEQRIVGNTHRRWLREGARQDLPPNLGIGIQNVADSPHASAVGEEGVLADAVRPCASGEVTGGINRAGAVISHSDS